MTTNPCTPEANEIVDAVELVLINMALYDIHRCLGMRPPKSFLKRTTRLADGVHPAPAAFLLGCCLIEAAGHFYIGPPAPNFTADSQQAFERFATDYLKSKGYEPVTLYKAMRCGLAHSYTTASNRFNFKQSYKLVHTHWTHHLDANIAHSDIRYVNLQDFIADIEEALHAFLSDVRLNKNNMQERFLAWSEDSGWLASNLTPSVGSNMATIIASTTTPPSRPPTSLADKSWQSAISGIPPANWNWGGTAPASMEQWRLDLADSNLIRLDDASGVYFASCAAASGTGNPQTHGIAPTLYTPTATLSDNVRIPKGLQLPASFGMSLLKGSKTQRRKQKAKIAKNRITT